MEITKFSSQLFATLEQVRVYLRQALNTLTNLGRGALEKTRRLQESCRASNLRKVPASSLDAIVVTSGKITKFSSQLFATLEQVTVYLRQALNTLTNLGRGALEKTRRLQETRRAIDLRKVLASSLDAIVVTSDKITKFSSQRFATLEQVTVYLRQALNTLTNLGRGALEKTRRLQETRRATDLRTVLASSLDAIVVTSGKITKFSSQRFATLEQVTVYLRQALNTLTVRGKGVLENTRRLQETRRAIDLRTVLASSLDAIVVTSGKITKFSSRLFVALEQVTVHLRRALSSLTGRGKNAVEKTRRLQETRRARENDLRELLASSLDAIVVTNVDRRFVAANPKALHLFGVSEANIRHFTIDAFLLSQIRYFDGNGLPFISREKKQGECQIRRLDGSLRLTEFIFVANFVPFRHLFRFRNVRECAPRRRAAA
jgi:PAS domain-containing protein